MPSGLKRHFLQCAILTAVCSVLRCLPLPPNARRNSLVISSKRDSVGPISSNELTTMLTRPPMLGTQSHHVHDPAAVLHVYRWAFYLRCPHASEGAFSLRPSTADAGQRWPQWGRPLSPPVVADCARRSTNRRIRLWMLPGNITAHHRARDTASFVIM